MSRGSSSAPAESRDLEQLRDEVSSLTATCRLLVSAIDELRVELQYVAHNGLPAKSGSDMTILKRMAADPLADDWGERLVTGSTQEKVIPPDQSPSPVVGATKDNHRDSDSGMLF